MTRGKVAQAVITMMERAAALQSSPLVDLEGTTLYPTEENFGQLAEMMVQGMDAPARDLMAFLDAFAQQTGMEDYRGQLLEVMVVGSLVGRADNL